MPIEHLDVIETINCTTTHTLALLFAQRNAKQQRKYSMFTLMIQEHENSIQEFRTIESVAFAHKMGENGGFYKVQLIDENGVIVSEWKA